MVGLGLGADEAFDQLCELATDMASKAFVVVAS
jgi:hypothetical protein